jgi:catechol 2,3-dioxygenase-like lactoylglutathione lyase family enzyme
MIGACGGRDKLPLPTEGEPVKILGVLLFLATVLWPGVPYAQLASPSESGVAMGHWHLHVRDLEANRKFWALMGGAPAAKLGDSEVFSFPNAFVILSPMPPAGGTVGTVINHVGFQVPSVEQTAARLKAAGLPVEPGNPNVAQIYVLSPDGVRVEVLEDKAMTVPVRHHHIHWNVPEPTIPDIQAWYVRTLGAIAGKRGNFPAADVPGANLTFTASADKNIGTRGRALDHIGFEVTNLEAFCKRLEASGVKFDRPYAATGGLGTAWLTDPWGTVIELTEGLRARR